MNYSSLGADYSWLAPLTEGVSNVVGGIFGKTAAPAPVAQKPTIPWVPLIGIGAGALVVITFINMPKRKRIAAPAS